MQKKVTIDILTLPFRFFKKICYEMKKELFCENKYVTENKYFLSYKHFICMRKNTH